MTDDELAQPAPETSLEEVLALVRGARQVAQARRRISEPYTPEDAAWAESFVSAMSLVEAWITGIE